MKSHSYTDDEAHCAEVKSILIGIIYRRILWNDQTQPRSKRK